jgi:UDP:flavonoid glycosyltransferase YjiC (YdhE family)
MASPLTPTESDVHDYAPLTPNTPSAALKRQSSTTPIESTSAPLGQTNSVEASLTKTHSDAATDLLARPSLLNRYATEIALPVNPRPVILNQHRRSTGAGNTTRLELTASNIAAARDARDASSDDSSDSSSDDDDDYSLTMQKSHTAPDTSNQMSARGLNRVRRNPKRYNRKLVDNDHFTSFGRVARDGRLKIDLNEAVHRSGYLSKALGNTLTQHLRPEAQKEAQAAEEKRAAFAQAKSSLQIPGLNIVIMVIGSRGDIQPFMAIGRILKEKGHRVRIASHPAFRDFVEKEIGLEFFSVGGDPSELMAFMVKNPGLIPSLDTIKAGEIGKRRAAMSAMFAGFWRACINTTDDEHDLPNLRMLGDRHPFIADAIIANPPSFAHYHIAEKLGVPLHLIFTFPYTPTQAFPHPLANIKTSNVEDQSTVNFISYPLVDLMTWQGLGDLINKFRVKTLNLEPVSTLWAPGQLSRLKVATTYLWSPALVPKPADWGPEIDIAGYVFLDLAKSFKPPADLVEFLEGTKDKRPLIYIGFGSIAGISDPAAFTRMILDGVGKADVRAIISKGWGGMGEGMDKPDGVFMIDNVPHDWLFPKVDAVVHHGGAGTTAAGLKFGKPTFIIPFFGDQPFWANMVSKAGAGVKEALPLKKLDSDKFAQGIRECLGPEAKAAAESIAEGIVKEGDGAENAVDSFHRSLPLEKMRCGVFPDRVAVWSVKHTKMRLSALAADLLVENKQLNWTELELLRHVDWKDFQGPGEPITGAGGVVVNAFHEAYDGLHSIHENAKRDYRKYEKRKRRKQGYSVEDAIVLPGKVQHAVRGTSADEARREHARVSAELNLHGEAAPPRQTLAPHGTNDSMRPQLDRTETAGTDTHIPVVLMKDVGKGLGDAGKAIVRLPSNIFYAVTLGFRNAPRLYGDTTVRPPHEPITGFRSGVQVAGKEFCYGLYDGVTGLVRIPHKDYHDSGAMGLPKGLARGIGGLALKPIAGTMGLPAYTAKGLQQSIRKRVRDTRKTERWVRRARMSQGAKAVNGLRMQAAGLGQRGPPDARHDGELERMRTKVLTQWSKQAVDLAESGTGNGDGALGVSERAVNGNGNSKQGDAKMAKKAETF